MKLSYAITVCNEFVEIQKLISFLLENKKQQDEIVILYDIINGDKRVEEYLRSHSVNGEFNWHPGEFKGHFAMWSWGSPFTVLPFTTQKILNVKKNKTIIIIPYEK